MQLRVGVLTQGGWRQKGRQVSGTQQGLEEGAPELAGGTHGVGAPELSLGKGWAYPRRKKGERRDNGAELYF